MSLLPSAPLSVDMDMERQVLYNSVNHSHTLTDKISMMISPSNKVFCKSRNWPYAYSRIIICLFVFLWWLKDEMKAVFGQN